MVAESQARGRGATLPQPVREGSVAPSPPPRAIEDGPSLGHPQKRAVVPMEEMSMP